MICNELGILHIVDPDVDELEDIAEFLHGEIERTSIFHALNHKAQLEEANNHNKYITS